MIGFDGRHLSVLLVDDYEGFRRLVRTVLEVLGIVSVMEAADGAEGLRCLTDGRPDLIIVDYRMAEVDGLHFVRRLRQDPAFAAVAAVPVLMVSGYAQPHLVVEARAAGVTEFLAKPVSPRALQSRIVRLIQSGHAAPDREEEPHPDGGG